MIAALCSARNSFRHMHGTKVLRALLLLVKGNSFRHMHGTKVLRALLLLVKGSSFRHMHGTKVLRTLLLLVKGSVDKAESRPYSTVGALYCVNSQHYIATSHKPYPNSCSNQNPNPNPNTNLCPNLKLCRNIACIPIPQLRYAMLLCCTNYSKR